MKIIILIIICSIVRGTPMSKLDFDKPLDTTSSPLNLDVILDLNNNISDINWQSNATVDDVWQVKLGDICQIARFPLPSGEPTRYLKCMKPHNDEKEWPWLDKGIWILKQCPPGYEFHTLTHSCRNRRYLRRQQSMCQSTPTPSQCSQQPQYSVQPQSQMSCQCPQGINICACPEPQTYQPMPMAQPQSGYGGGGQGGGGGCPPPAPQPNCPQPPQPCPLAPQGTSNAQAGDICSWMLAPLAADPASKKCFLQCAPAPGNAYCGRWVRMPCAPATIFDVNVQVCVHDPCNVPGQVPPWNPANSPSCNSGTAVGSCNANMQCPGQSTCQTPQQSPQQCSLCCIGGNGGPAGGTGYGAGGPPAAGGGYGAPPAGGGSEGGYGGQGMK